MTNNKFGLFKAISNLLSELWDDVWCYYQGLLAVTTCCRVVPSHFDDNTLTVSPEIRFPWFSSRTKGLPPNVRIESQGKWMEGVHSEEIISAV